MTFRGEALLPEIEFPVQCVDADCEYLTQYFCSVLVGSGVNIRLNRVGLCEEHLETYTLVWISEMVHRPLLCAGLTIVRA